MMLPPSSKQKIPAQMEKLSKAPNYASSGLSDAKIPDAQAGWEKAMAIFPAIMGGKNYIHHAAGMLESMNSVMKSGHYNAKVSLL